jgi:plasmid stabilization system protein ParE
VKRRLLVGSEAQGDLTQAVEWLSERSLQALASFESEVESVFASVLANPEKFPIIYSDTRRALLRRHPYAVFFVMIGEETILITGVIHQSRSPRIWKRRSLN